MLACPPSITSCEGKNGLPRHWVVMHNSHAFNVTVVVSTQITRCTRRSRRCPVSLKPLMGFFEMTRIPAPKDCEKRYDPFSYFP